MIDWPQKALTSIEEYMRPPSECPRRFVRRCSVEVKEIIEACARVDAEVRPSMREIVDMLHSIC